MKARAGRDIDIKVGVMHAMQSPEPRDVMEKPVLGIDGQIEKKERDDDGEQRRHGDIVEETPSPLLGDKSNSRGARRHQNPREKCVNEHDGKVIGPSTFSSHRSRALRPEPFAHDEQHEHADKAGQPDGCFVFHSTCDIAPP